MATYRSSLVGVFTDRTQAQNALRALRRAGFREDQMGVIAHDIKVISAAPGEESWEEGAIAGGITGAGVGGLWALGIAAGILPAIGPIIAGGILASVLASAGGGAVVGGLVGALLGLGFSSEEAEYYEKEFKSGRTLVTVMPEGRADEAARIMEQHGGTVRTTGMTTTSGEGTYGAAAGRTAVPSGRS